MKSGWQWVWRIALFALAIINCSAAELPADVIKRLADDEFKVREQAQADLLKWAREHEQAATTMLFQQHRQSQDPEVKVRCMEILEIIARDGYAEHGQGFIGVQMMDDMVRVPGKDQHQAAIRVTFVLPGLSADKAGIKAGDILLGINGKIWPSPATESMRREVMGMKPMTKVTLQVLRNEKVEDVEVTLVKRPVTADNPMLEGMPERVAELEKRLWQDYFEKWKQSHDPG